MITLVLDMGGIFFKPAWRLEGITHASQMLGVSTETLKKEINRHKRVFYTGQISEEQYWESILRNLDVPTFKSRDLENLYRSYVRPVPETLSLLPELSSRYNLFACNNCPKEWMDYRTDSASLNKYFSHFFTSGYLGAMKPDDEMYSKVFSGPGVAKETVVYIDDNDEYVSLVRNQYGVQSHLYETPDSLRFWIR